MRYAVCATQHKAHNTQESLHEHDKHAAHTRHPTPNPEPRTPNPAIQPRTLNPKPIQPQPRTSQRYGDGLGRLATLKSQIEVQPLSGSEKKSTSINAPVYYWHGAGLGGPVPRLSTKKGIVRLSDGTRGPKLGGSAMQKPKQMPVRRRAKGSSPSSSSSSEDLHALR